MLPCVCRYSVSRPAETSMGGQTKTVPASDVVSYRHFLYFIFILVYFLVLLQVFIVVPASIATLAQRLPLRWANVGSPLGQRGFVNWPNVCTLTLGRRWHNVTPMVVCQPCTNIGQTEAALLAFCEGNPSVTDRSPVEQTVELSNQ